PGSTCPPTIAPSSTFHWAAPVCVQPVRSLPLKSGRQAIGDCADSASDRPASTRDFMGRILFRVVRPYRTNEEKEKEKAWPIFRDASSSGQLPPTPSLPACSPPAWLS